MTEVRATKIQYAEQASQLKGVESSCTSSVNTVPMTSEGSQGSNVDTYNTTNKNNSNKPQRSKEELFNAFKGLCAEYGISVKELEEKEIIEKISGLNSQRLLNISNDEINKLVNCLKAALDKHNFKSGKVKLEDVIKTANDYNIAIHTGWTIDEFEKAQKNKKHESLMQRLERVYPALVKAGKIEEALDKYFNNYFDAVIKNKLANVTDPKKRESIIANEKKRQLQDFGRLLANTPDEEKGVFKQAIKSLYANNRLKGFEALIQSFETQEARTELVDECSPEYIEEIQKTEDRFGDKSDSKEIAGITEIIAENQSEVGRKNFHQKFEEKKQEFFEKNKEIIARIYEKEKNGEKLTPEEEEIKEKIEEYYTPVSSAEIVGTANNQIISEEFRDSFLETLNEDAYKYDNYRDVIKAIKEFVEENQDKLSMNKDDFEALINKSTNGNYDIVKNDVANNTTTPLNAPASTQTQAVNTEAFPVQDKVSGKQDLGFYNSPDAVNTTKSDELKANLYNESSSNILNIKSRDEIAREEYGTFDNAIAKGASASVVKTLSKGKTTTCNLIKAIFNENNASNSVIEYGKYLFSILVPSMQEISYTGIKIGKNKEIVAEELSYEQREKLMTNAGVNEKTMLEELQEKAEKLRGNLA